jgi:metal-dependent HD superfamily phosphatase/phosphodiesterase
MRLPSLRCVVNSTSRAMNKLQNVQMCADFYDRIISTFYPDTRVVHLNSILHKKKNHHKMQEHK